MDINKINKKYLIYGGIIIILIILLIIIVKSSDLISLNFLTGKSLNNTLNQDTNATLIQKREVNFYNNFATSTFSSANYLKLVNYIKYTCLGGSQNHQDCNLNGQCNNNSKCSDKKCQNGPKENGKCLTNQDCYQYFCEPAIIFNPLADSAEIGNPNPFVSLKDLKEREAKKTSISPTSKDTATSSLLSTSSFTSTTTLNINEIKNP